MRMKWTQPVDQNLPKSPQISPLKTSSPLSQFKMIYPHLRNITHLKNLTETENIYFRRNANIKHRLPQFYIIIKIHKQPYKTRPIVSCVGSFLNAFSKWVDTHLQKLLPFNPTYTKDTSHILQDIKKIQNLPSHSRLFTCDAESMYTNINNTHGIEKIRKKLTFLNLLKKTIFLFVLYFIIT